MNSNGGLVMAKSLEKLNQLFVSATCPYCGFEMLLVITEHPDLKKRVECPACRRRIPLGELLKNV